MPWRPNLSSHCGRAGGCRCSWSLGLPPSPRAYYVTPIGQVLLCLRTHTCGSFEIDRDGIYVDVGPGVGLHELLPTLVVATLIVLGDVVLRDCTRPHFLPIVVGHAHGQVSQVPPRHRTGARHRYLTPVV